MVSNFYGTEIEIWAGFGLVGITEKKLGQLWGTFEVDFSCFQGHFFKNNFKNIVAFALKSCINEAEFF